MRFHAVRMIVALAAIMLCTTARPVLAQTCIQGRVIDDTASGACVAGATVTVSLPTGGQSATTGNCVGSGANYTISNLNLQCNSTYTVSVTALPSGYVTISKSTTTITTSPCILGPAAGPTSAPTDCAVAGDLVVHKCPPVTISCPTTNITVPGETGQCGAHVPFNVSASGGCGSLTITCLVGDRMVHSGDFFPVGTTEVFCEATDTSGQVARCSFTITVTPALKVTCPGNKTVDAPPGTCSAPAALVSPGAATATGSCTPIKVSDARSDQQPLDAPYPVGTTIIAWTATDSKNNQDTCFQTITVPYVPTIACPGNKTVDAPQGTCEASVDPGTATAPSCPNASVAVKGVRSDEQALNAPYPAGTTTITWTAIATTGQVSRQTTCQQTITVLYTPAITCPANILTKPDAGQDFATVAVPLPTVSNCPSLSAPTVVGTRSDGQSLGTLSNGTFTAPYPLGVTTITWTATGTSSTPASCQMTVTVHGPMVSVSPTSIDFGNQPFGTTSGAQVVTVTNVGDVPVTINGASLSDSRNFAIVNGGRAGTLAPGGMRQIGVVFRPINVSPHSATLSISDDAVGSPQIVQLTGNGVNPPPSPHLGDIQPRNLDFGNVELGTSATQSVTVFSNGGAPLDISARIEGANSGDFSISAGGSATLDPGTNRPISITFTPMALGPRTANLLITTNASPFDYLVVLSGNGVQAVRPPIQKVMQVTQPVAHSPGLEFFNENPPPPGSTDLTAVAGIGPNGALLLVDWAGTALVQLPPPFNMADILLDPAVPPPPDGVGLARLLRVAVSPSGIDAAFALRADNNLGIYRLANGNLSLLGQIPNPRGARELAISDAGQTAYVANIDPTNPNSPLALYQAAPTGSGTELLRQGQSTVNGAAIQSFSDLAGNGKGDLSVLVALPAGANGPPGQAVLRKLGENAFVPLAVTGQTVVEKGRGTGVTGVLTALRRPRIGPDGSVVFLGAGSDFVNFYLVRPDGSITALLGAPGTDLTILNEAPGGGPSSGHRFDYEIAADETVGLQAALANPTDSVLALVAPSGQVTPIVSTQRNIEPILPPVFGPGGLVFFLAEDQTLPTDRNGRYQVGLYRYRPGGAAPEAVAQPGPGQPVPGWPADTQLLGISQRPVVFGSSLYFGVVFGGPQSLPVPTTALFQVPVNGTLANGGMQVALEGQPENNASQLAMLRDLSYQSNGTLVAYGLMPGAGPLIAPPPASASAAGLAHTQALQQASQIVPLVADGDTLGQGMMRNVIPPLLSLAPDRDLFGARTSLTQSWDHEGLFTSKKELVAETTQAVTALPNTVFNGFADTQMYMLGPPSVSADGRVVFKALLDRNKTTSAGIFQWTTGAPTLIQGTQTADPRDLLRWAAGQSGLTYILIRPQGGVGRLYVGMNGLVPSPVSVSGLTDLTDLALDSNGDVFVVGSGPIGSGVFQLVGTQYTPMPVAVKGTTPVPAIPSILGAGYTFDGTFFQLFPDSSRGRLIFRATISKGGDTKLAEFAFGGNGLVTRQVAVLLSLSERTLISSSLGSTPPSQNRNGITVSANPGGGRWSLVLFRGNNPPQTIAQEGQMLPNGTQIKVLDAGPLLQQETDPEFHNGPVFTIDDAGNVAFLASDGKAWGVYQSPAVPTAPIR